MSRISLIQRFSKEDCLHIIQTLSISLLQEVVGINLKDKTEILEFLKVGLKREDLNFCLSNSSKLIDKIPFRDDFHLRDENRISFRIRNEFVDEILPPETRIFKMISHPDTETTLISYPDTETTMISHPDTETTMILYPDAETTMISHPDTKNNVNLENCRAEDTTDDLEEDQDNIDESFSTTNLQQLVGTKASKYQIIQALNERNRHQERQREFFQSRMNQQHRCQLSRFEKEKHIFSHQDSHYRRTRDIFLPFCKFLNIDFDEMNSKISIEEREKRRLDRINKRI
jgi:hypothetical protein